jgi:hypothetical protein
MGIGVAKAPIRCLATHTLAPTPTVSTATSPAPVEGFTFIGNGLCQDSTNSFYSEVAAMLPYANGNECIEWCSQNLHPDFVGTSEYKTPDGSLCSCLFSGGLPEDIAATDYIPEVYINFTNSGFGPVQAFQFYGAATYCYQYDVSHQFE